MVVKIKMWGNLKATLRFGNPREEQWFSTQMVIMRDSDPKMHPEISVKDANRNNIPPLPKPKPTVVENVKPVEKTKK